MAEYTKTNQRKLDTPTSTHTPKVHGGHTAEAKKQRTDRYRAAILYDSDDENTSNPKLEKAIEQDKERIEEEHKQWLAKNKTKTPVSKARDEKSKKKMASSSDKFKAFLTDDIVDKSSDQPESRTNADISNISHRTDADQSDDDEVVEVKTKTPVASGSSDNTSSAQTSRLQSPDVAEPVWKTKRPFQLSDDEEIPRPRRRRISSSSEEDSQNVRDISQMKQLLQGVVFAISGIQVRKYHC